MTAEYIDKYEWWCLGRNGGTNILCPEWKDILGNHEASTGGDACTVSGWACDRSKFDKPLQINIYADGAAGTGTLVGSTLAGNNRADLLPYCGNNSAHGFSYSVPNTWKDEAPHLYYAYAVGIDSSDKVS
jgi:hypothetical protein